MSKIDLSDFIARHPTHSITWNCRHIERYKNQTAARQWLAARANLAVTEQEYLNAIEAWEDGMGSHEEVDRLYIEMGEWRRVSEAFYAQIDTEPQFSDVWCGDVWSGDE